MSLALTDSLAWVVVAAFVASAALAGRRRRLARGVAALAWALFAVFWALLVDHFLFVQRSPIEGVLSAVAVPACLYTGYLVWTERASLLTLSRAVAVMGLVYLPFQTSAFLHEAAVESLTRQVEWLIHALGYTPEIVHGTNGYRNTFLFVGPTGHRYLTHILLACTGIGSMAIVAGLVAAVRAPVRRKAEALALTLPVIYALNVVRVTFITLANGNQWFAALKPVIVPLFQLSDPHLTSYIVADRVISQSLSVLALVALTLAVLRVLPELGGVLDDVAYVATGREYDFASRFR